MEYPGDIVIPAKNGKRGHPLIIPHALRGEILGSSDETRLRDILKNHAHLIREIPVNDAGIHKDIDTTQDLEEATR